MLNYEGKIKKDGKVYKVYHTYLGKSLCNERMEQIVFFNNWWDYAIYWVNGAKTKRRAIEYAKKLFINNFKEGVYDYKKRG
jgi:hypothetical protein